MPSKPYTPPLDQLLTLGHPIHPLPETYFADLGMGAQHIAELIRMATDEVLLEAESEGPEERFYAPIHAWRALGELGAVEAVEPLLSILWRIDEQDFDWMSDEIPNTFTRIGPAILPTLCTFLANDEQDGWSRATVSDAIYKISQKYPETREQTIKVFIENLQALTERPQFFEPHEVLASSILCDLLQMKARDALPAIEAAFAADRIDPTMCGDWEDVQIEFGLKAQREKPAHNMLEVMDARRKMWRQKREQRFKALLDRNQKKIERAKHSDKKAKRKQEAKSRKQNRKKK